MQNDPINFFDRTGLDQDDPCDELEDFEEGCIGEQEGRDDAAKEQEARRKALLAKRQKRFDAVKQAIHDPASIDPIFGESILDCIAGLESEWNPNVPSGSHVGMYQINRSTWEGTKTKYDFDTYATDPRVSTAVAIAALYQKLAAVKGVPLIGIGTGDFTAADLFQAIITFGENNGQYGIAIVNCSDALTQGNFEGATEAIDGYRAWRKNNK